MISQMREKGFTLVELMIVVAILGILAALAIPAFVTYMNRAKAAEAEGIIQTMSDGARAYYEGDQQWSNPSGGAEPWHPSNAADPSQRRGMSVGFDLKVFPGGTGADVRTHDNIPAGGGQLATNVHAAVGEETQTLNSLNLQLDDSTYFGYRYKHNAETGNDAAIVMMGCHDFSGAGSGIEDCDATFGSAAADADSNYDHHIVVRACLVRERGAYCLPMFTDNEFE